MKEEIYFSVELSPNPTFKFKRSDVAIDLTWVLR